VRPVALTLEVEGRAHGLTECLDARGLAEKPSTWPSLVDPALMQQGCEPRGVTKFLAQGLEPQAESGPRLLNVGIPSLFSLEPDEASGVTQVHHALCPSLCEVHASCDVQLDEGAERCARKAGPEVPHQKDEQNDVQELAVSGDAEVLPVG
jgi:hypothetical protein